MISIKNQKKEHIVTSIIVFIAGIIMSLALVYFFISPSNKLETTKEENENVFLKNQTIETLESEIEKNEGTDVDELIYALMQESYGQIKKYQGYVVSFTEDITSLEETLENRDISKINYEVLKTENIEVSNVLLGFFKDLENNHLYIQKIDERYLVRTDNQIFIDKYGNEMTNALLEITQFAIKNDYYNIYNQEERTFRLNKIAELIVEGEAIQEKYPKYKYIATIDNYTMNNLKIYFGSNHEAFLTPDETYSEEYLKTIKEHSIKYKDSSLNKKINSFIDALEKPNNKANEDILDWFDENIKPH